MIIMPDFFKACFNVTYQFFKLASFHATPYQQTVDHIKIILRIWIAYDIAIFYAYAVVAIIGNKSSQAVQVRFIVVNCCDPGNLS
jgi:hypothetical protein